MSKPPYGRFEPNELTLRDELAIDRTVLANERTLLAYIRTGLGFLVLGLTFHHFLDQAIYHFIGFGFMGFAVLIFLLGGLRYFQIRQDLRRLRESEEAKERQATDSDEQATPS